MSRLLVHVEGETEETFVNEILAPHLRQFGYTQVIAQILGNARRRDRRGGIRGWDSARGDILNHLREDGGRLATTMVDYYALPQSGTRAWPGRNRSEILAFLHKARTVQDALLADVSIHMGPSFNPVRFIPYVMMHEFEGLLFSDCDRFARGIGQPALARQLHEIRNAFDSPEEINDSPITCPSKRVELLVPGYEKPLLGVLAVLEIGLDAIRAECPHFRQWLEQLEVWPERGVG